MFTLGSLLVAIQVAGGQLTPRIIATTLLRNNVIRFAVGLFAFTLFCAVGSRREATIGSCTLAARLPCFWVLALRWPSCS